MATDQNNIVNCSIAIMNLNNDSAFDIIFFGIAWEIINYISLFVWNWCVAKDIINKELKNEFMQLSPTLCCLDINI